MTQEQLFFKISAGIAYNNFFNKVIIGLNGLELFFGTPFVLSILLSLLSILFASKALMVGKSLSWQIYCSSLEYRENKFNHQCYLTYASFGLLLLLFLLLTF